MLKIFETNHLFLSKFRKADDKATVKKKTFTKSKGGWKCGEGFIPKKNKCYTDPVSGKKLKEPTAYSQYRKKRAEAVKREAKGLPLTDKEKVYAQRVEGDRDKLKDKNFVAKTKKALKSVGYSSNVLSGGIADVDPLKVKVDPKRFQYKIAGANNATGSVDSLAGVKKYDPNLAGIIQVWADPKDGNTYVVNGHNRLALEKKMGVKKRPARFLDVKSPKEARAVGALTNIAEGRGNARDAAKFFRDSGISKEDLEKRGVPLREKIATDGIAMSRLSDGLFNQVIQGDLPDKRAVIIGSKLKDTTQQEALFKLVAKEEKRGRKITNDVIEELADMTSTAPSQKQEGNLLTLLGFDPEERSLALEKAEISASIKSQLNKDKKLFGTVGKNKAAESLKRGGNKINTDMSAAISQTASTTLTLFEKKKFEAGKIDQVLNQSAERLANGEKRSKVATEARQEIEEYLKKQFKYGENPRRRQAQGNARLGKRSTNNFRKGQGDRTNKANFNKQKEVNAYYFQTRKGKRVRVKKGKNRINLYNGTKVGQFSCGKLPTRNTPVKRAVARGSIPIKSGEIYGKGVVSIGDRTSSIKKTQGVALSAKNGGVKVTGRVGAVKGGIAIAKKKGRQIDQITYGQFFGGKLPTENTPYSNGNSEVSNFSATYKRRSKKGKVSIVRKGKRKTSKNLIRGAELLGTAGGLVGGAKLGEFLVNAAGRNGAIRNAAMAGGGLAGGAIALMLAAKASEKYEK